MAVKPDGRVPTKLELERLHTPQAKSVSLHAIIAAISTTTAP
jgi:hypothetical protein